MSDPLLTRAQLVTSIRDELGIPVKLSTIEKAAMNGTGPAPAAKYGRAYLYEKAPAFEWAQGLITPAAE